MNWLRHIKGFYYLKVPVGVIWSYPLHQVICKGDKRPESEGTKIYVTGATIFQTGIRKNENYKFSFE